MVLDPIPQPLPVHFFGSRPQPPTSAPHAQVQESMQMAHSHTHSLLLPPSYYLSLQLCTSTIEIVMTRSPPFFSFPPSPFLSLLQMCRRNGVCACLTLSLTPSHSLSLPLTPSHSLSLPLTHLLSLPLTHSLSLLLPKFLSDYAQVQWSMRMPHSRIHSLSFSRIPNLSNYAQMQ